MTIGSYGPCMCGALDCKSCGPAQGYYEEDDTEDGYDPREEDEWDDRRHGHDMPVWEDDDGWA